MPTANETTTAEAIVLLDEVENTIGNLPPTVTSLFNSWRTLDGFVKDNEQQCVFIAGNIHMDPLSPHLNWRGQLLSWARSDALLAGQQLCALRVMLDTLEKSDEVKDARKVCEPLFAKRDKLKAQLDADRTALCAARAALNQAAEEARQKALAEAEKTEPVVAARDAFNAAIRRFPVTANTHGIA